MKYFNTPIFNISSELFFIIDTKNNRFQELSPNWDQTFGWTIDELYSNKLSSYIADKDFTFFLKKLNESVSLSLKKNSFEARILHKNKNEIILHWTLTFDNTTQLLFGICQVIDEHKENHFLTETLNSLPSFISYLDLDFNIKFENKKSHHFFAEDHSKKQMQVMLMPYMNQAMKGKIQNIELILPANDSNLYKIVNIQLIPRLHRLFNEERVLGIYQVVHDITDIKNSENTAILKEKKLQALFNILSQGIVVQNVTGNITEFNPSALRILSLTKDQLLGKTSYDKQWKVLSVDMDPIGPEEHPSVMALTSGIPVIGKLMGVYISATEINWMRVNAVPLFLPNEVKPHEVVVTFELISKTEGTRPEKEKLFKSFS